MKSDFYGVIQAARAEWSALQSGAKPLIMVGTATCGRSAGSLAALDALRQETAQHKLDCHIVEVGCIGLCYAEPIVGIAKAGRPTIFYGGITPKRATKLVESYLLNDDPAVVAAGTPYLEVRLAAMVGVGMNFAFRGYWSAVHMTRLYFGTLVFMHSLNIFLNWVFIFGNLGAPEMGVTGAGFATTLSIYTGTLCYIMLALRHARDHGFMRGIPSRETMGTMIRVSLPSSLQQLFFSAGMVVLFWIVGLIGTRELAAANVLMHLVLVAILPMLGLGLAAASLVGNALGREEIADAKQWGWNVAVMGLLMAMAIGLPAALLRDQIPVSYTHLTLPTKRIV